jgi:hypothetical protein
VGNRNLGRDDGVLVDVNPVVGTLMDGIALGGGNRKTRRAGGGVVERMVVVVLSLFSWTVSFTVRSFGDIAIPSGGSRAAYPRLPSSSIATSVRVGSNDGVAYAFATVDDAKV